MELNAEQIKKALDYCVEYGHCAKCPTGTNGNCDIEAKALALINSQEQKIKELTEENKVRKGLNTMLDNELLRLGEENEMLRAEVSVKKKLLDKCVDLEDKVRADTVRKMQQLIEEKTDGCDIIPLNSTRPIDTIYQISKKQLDQIAKGMIDDKL